MPLAKTAQHKLNTLIKRKELQSLTYFPKKHLLA